MPQISFIVSPVSPEWCRLYEAEEEAGVALEFLSIYGSIAVWVGVHDDVVGGVRCRAKQQMVQRTAKIGKKLDCKVNR